VLVIGLSALICSGPTISVSIGALGLEVVHALGRRGDGQAADVVQAAGLAADLLDLLVEPDGVALQGSHIRIGVQGVEATGRVPRGPGGEFRALDQDDVLPAELGEMIEDAASDHAAADDGHLNMRFHGFRPLPKLEYGPTRPNIDHDAAMAPKSIAQLALRHSDTRPI
jgi:hypothetical protein